MVSFDARRVWERGRENGCFPVAGESERGNWRRFPRNGGPRVGTPQPEGAVLCLTIGTFNLNIYKVYNVLFLKYMDIQTYRAAIHWHPGDKLEKAGLVSKAEAHDKGLLHQSVHLLLFNTEGKVCCRKRDDYELRYAGLWTTTIGTHVAPGKNYQTTLAPLLPISLDLDWVGEFRVQDVMENEVNGLYVARVDEARLPVDFMRSRTFLSDKKLIDIVAEHGATPHLVGAYTIAWNSET